MHKEHQGHNQHSRIEHVSIFIALSKEFLLLVPRVIHDLLVELIAHCNPLGTVGTREGSFIREAKTLSEIASSR